MWWAQYYFCINFSGKIIVDANNIWQKLNLRLLMQMKESAVLITPIIKQIGNVETQDRFLDQQEGKIQDWRNLGRWVFMSGTLGKYCLTKEPNTSWNKYKCFRQMQHLKPMTEVFSYLCGVLSLKWSHYIHIELYSSILFRIQKKPMLSLSRHIFIVLRYFILKYCFYICEHFKYNWTWHFKAFKITL